MGHDEMVEVDEFEERRSNEMVIRKVVNDRKLIAS